MDFSDFDLRDPADEGVWLHLEEPFSGEPLYRQEDNEIVTQVTDHPCRVKVRGNHSEDMRRLIRDWERRESQFAMRVMRATDKQAEAVMRQKQDAQENHHKAILLCAVMDWQNITARKDPKDRKSKPELVDRTDENVLRLMRNNGFQTQILRKAGDEEDFFKRALTG